MLTFEDAVRIARESAVIVFERRAHETGLVISICAICKAYLAERPSLNGHGRIEYTYCDQCTVSMTGVSTTGMIQ